MQKREKKETKKKKTRPKKENEVNHPKSILIIICHPTYFSKSISPPSPLLCFQLSSCGPIFYFIFFYFQQERLQLTCSKLLSFSHKKMPSLEGGGRRRQGGRAIYQVTSLPLDQTPRGQQLPKKNKQRISKNLEGRNETSSCLLGSKKQTHLRGFCVAPFKRALSAFTSAEVAQHMLFFYYYLLFIIIIYFLFFIFYYFLKNQIFKSSTLKKNNNNPIESLSLPLRPQYPISQLRCCLNPHKLRKRNTQEKSN